GPRLAATFLARGAVAADTMEGFTRSCRSASFLLRSYAPAAVVLLDCGYAEPVCQPTPRGARSVAMMTKRRVHRLEFGDDAFLDVGKHGHARGIRHRLSGAHRVADADEVLVQR